jgi:hypothetical protein
MVSSSRTETIGPVGFTLLDDRGIGFAIQTDAVSHRSISLFTVVSVCKRLQRLTSEKYDL